MNKPIIIVDTREKQPYKFKKSDSCAGMKVEKLDFGDYQVEGHPNLICIERKKSVNELYGNLGKNRKRFEAELQRMVDAGCKFRYIIIEDYYSSIFKNPFSIMKPIVVFESITALELKYGVHFIFCGNRKMAHRIARSFLIKAWNYRTKGII